MLATTTILRATLVCVLLAPVTVHAQSIVAPSSPPDSVRSGIAHGDAASEDLHGHERRAIAVQKRLSGTTGVDVAPDELEIMVQADATATTTLTLSNSASISIPFNVVIREKKMAHAPGARKGAPSSMSVDGSMRATYETAVAITHSESMNVLANSNAPACVREGEGDTYEYSHESSYWRVFDLREFALEGGLVVSSVDIGVHSVQGTSLGSTVRLHTLEGELAMENLTFVEETEFILEQGTFLEVINVPVGGVFDAGDLLVVEWHVESGESTNTLYWPGANPDGESGPSFMSATMCGITQPTEITELGFPDGHWVLAVNGTTESGIPVVMSGAPQAGSLASGDSQEVTISADATGLAPGTYRYNLAIITGGGSGKATAGESGSTITVPVTVAVLSGTSSEEGILPGVFSIRANYPNPFATSTRIEYELNQPAHVRVEVYDVHGRLVERLAESRQPPGSHVVDWKAGDLASGVYFVRVHTPEHAQTIRVVVAR